MKALPRELRARCEAVTKKLSDPRIAGAEGRIIRAEAQRIIDDIEAHRAQRGTMMKLLGKRQLTPTTDSNYLATPD
jgi:hypothetical protein